MGFLEQQEGLSQKLFTVICTLKAWKAAACFVI